MPSCCALMLCPHVVPSCCALVLCPRVVPSCCVLMLALCAYTVASCACTVCLWNLTQITPHRRACIMTWTYTLVSSCSRQLLFVELEHDALDNVSPIVKFFPGTWLILKLNRIIHILKRWTRIGSSSRSFELNNGTKGLWLVLILNCNPTR